jgi:replicative DNA helicase
VDKAISNYVVEQALLAYTLRNPEKIISLLDIVKPDDFGWNCYGWCWEAMTVLSEKGMRIDAITLGDELERANRLKDFYPPGAKQFSGRAALSMIREVITTEAGDSYAMTISDYSSKRAIDRWLTQAHAWAHNGRPAADIIADLDTSFSTLILHQGKARAHTVTMELATVRAIEASEAAGRGERAVTTGLKDLDKLLSPQKTELIVVAARPGVGKSALCATIAIHASQEGRKVKFFTAEMGATQVTQRLLSQLSNVSAFRIMRGSLSSEEWEKIHEAASALQELPIVICDLPEIKIGQIRSECRRDPVDVVILDYIQLANSDKKNDRRDLDIGEVTRGCKGLAKELDIPFFAAAQVGRAAEGREPTLADLRESGSIENDADSVLFIHRTDSCCELIIAKHRNGPLGKVPVYFSEETIKFHDGVYNNVSVNRTYQD